MVSRSNIRITSCNTNNNSNNKSNRVYSLQYPKNEEERWIVEQIKKLYSKLLIAHFNILKINANQRKELYEELLLKYKKCFGKEFIPEDNIEDETNCFNFNFDDNLDKENKRITIKNSIQSYVDDSGDEEAFCYHCDGPIELKDTEMCECKGHPYCCERCAVSPLDENDNDRYCILCVPLKEIENDAKNNTENENIEPIIPSSNSEKELTEEELRKLLGIELTTDSITKDSITKDSTPNESLPPYNEQNRNAYLNNPFIAKEA
jgi:hypothetical protein